MDARFNLTWSVGIVLAGVVGLGVCYKGGVLKGYVKGKHGPRSVKAQTCLNFNEIAALNVKNALGCPNGEKTEIVREFTSPAAPITLSMATKGASQAINLKATRKRSIRPGIEAEASLAMEIWNNQPEKRNPYAGLNGPRYRQPILSESKLAKAAVTNDSLDPIEKYLNDKGWERQAGAGTQPFTTLSDANVPASPIDVYSRILAHNNRLSTGVVATTTR